MTNSMGTPEERAVIVVIDGSPRNESATRQLAALACEIFSQLGAEVRFFDQRQYPLPLFDDEPATATHPSVQALFGMLEQMHGIVLVAPEYHHGISAALKNVLDWMSLMPKRRVPRSLLCGIIGGGGAMGCSGAALQATMVARSMKWWLLPDIVNIPTIWEAFEGNRLRDPELMKRLEEFCHLMCVWAKMFRTSTGVLESTASP